ncbi:ABC transporter substrate-binding protein [Alicyclobacillus fodiniaquatilis]|uniref:ABC transporter substrate-binding protein n=1 Tax=Alicyclobacillus fodiniaquatilis TaxID=1661150 RepID=A0ABW4JMT1_9BACL
MRKPQIISGICALVTTGLVVGCGSSQTNSNDKSNGGQVSITLEGPNQWTDSGTSFGPAWNTLVSDFEKKNPNIKVNLRVMPLASFSTTEASQIAAGTAPEIMFNQFTSQSYQLTPLTKYLKQPNPYVPGNKHWLDLFNSQYYNLNNATVTGDTGNYYTLPLNVVSIGLYYNQTVFKKSGIQSPPKTFQELLADCAKLKAHGYIPFGMTNSQLGLGWTYTTLSSMMLDKYFDKWNWYLPNGKPGKYTSLTIEDDSRAILTKQLTAQTPEVAETLQLLKQLSQYFSPGWSGIADNSGAGVDVRQFVQGKAAMIWGTNFGYQTIKEGNPNLKFASIPFPTVTTATTQLSTNAPARYGASIGGTTYVIPSTAKGENLAAAIKFLQFATSPKENQKWLQGSSGNSVIKGASSNPALQGFVQGSWAEQPRVPGVGGLSPQMNTTFPQLLQGYLLGSASLAQTEQKLESEWMQAAEYNVQQNKNWTGNWTKLG